MCEMKDQIKYIAAMLIYGTNGIVASFIDLPSEEIVLMRTLIGGACSRGSCCSAVRGRNRAP